jgi:glucosamine-6-phosphate deaminase
MRRHLFDHVNLPADAIQVPDGDSADLRAAARAFDDALADAGGLDICLLGIGANGHIGFNEPAAALHAETHVATLARRTRQSNADLFGGRLRDVPARGLTLGMGGILGARAVVLLATGAGKAEVVRRALAGPITTRLPASFLQAHPNAIAVLDRAAASRLPHAAPRRRRR